MASGEENIAVSKSSKSDAWFDRTIGYIEDIIMEEDFQILQNNFLEKYYCEFEDTEENKFIYTDIHKEYTQLVEKYICEQLHKLMSDFSMDEFQKQLIARKNDLEGEIFEMLVTFSDFLAFKEMMVDYKAEKDGRSVDLSSGLTVTSLSGSSNGFGLTGMSLSIGGPVTDSHKSEMMEPEDMIMEENDTLGIDIDHPLQDDRITSEKSSTSQSDTGGPVQVDCITSATEASLANRPTLPPTDVIMESPR